MHLMNGYSDPEYSARCTKTIHWLPLDDTMQTIISNKSTEDWNLLIYTIFYERKDILAYLCETKKVYLRSCLTSPFIVFPHSDASTFEDDDPQTAEYFVKEKSELYPLVLCIMINNLDAFVYLWQHHSSIWSDIHLALLLNYLYEASWMEGVSALLSLPSTH
jgi:hypothetical protein